MRYPTPYDADYIRECSNADYVSEPEWQILVPLSGTRDPARCFTRHASADVISVRHSLT